jgi:tight adherence protein C
MNAPDMASLRFGGMLVLLGALMLSLAGIALLLYSARITREAVTKRVDLIRPDIDMSISPKAKAPTLIRSGQHSAEEAERREVAKLMSRFGLPAWDPATVFTSVRLLTIAIVALLVFLGASHWSLTSGSRTLPLLLATAFGILGWFIPAWIVGKLIKGHTKAIVTGLPDSLELLVICVEAGLSFEDGIDRVSVVLRKSQPALAAELALTAADLKILPSREIALANLAARVDEASVRSVVTTLSQTLRYGTPLAQALRVVAGELRNDTLMRLEERANQLPTLMTIPMMLFIMPTIFMIVAGPAALKVIDSFKH